MHPYAYQGFGGGLGLTECTVESPRIQWTDVEGWKMEDGGSLSCWARSIFTKPATLRTLAAHAWKAFVVFLE